MADQTMMKVFSKLVSRIIGASTSIKKTAPCKLFCVGIRIVITPIRLPQPHGSLLLVAFHWIAEIPKHSVFE
jgi:hypothetical protein